MPILKSGFENIVSVKFYEDFPFTEAALRVNAKKGVYMGYAQCSISDSNDVWKGRKIALARAMLRASITREQRTKIWKHFHASSKSEMIINLDEVE